MSNRCPGCNKMASLEMADPEVELEIADTTVKATIRIVRNSECCGEEMKEATLEPEEEIAIEDLKGHVDEKTGEVLEGHELDVEEDSSEGTERTEGKGRGMRSFYGARVSYSITCSCQASGAGAICTGELEDDVQASSMEDLN